jgi:hypothetical protein
MTVLVLGMHRSGTSLTTRLVNLLGPNLCRPEDLARGRGGNERGHWESVPLVAENDRLLALVASRWWCPPTGRAEVDRLIGDADAREHAREAFERSHPTTPWVWKDPRTCLLLRFWVSALGTRPAAIIASRDPLDIAASLRARDGLSVQLALALWERHMRCALEGADGLATRVTTFQQLAADPARWCAATADFLRSAGVQARAPVDLAGVRAFVSAALHHDWSLGRERRRAALSAEQLALWEHVGQLADASGHLDGGVELPPETPTTARLFEEARESFGLVPTGPPPDPDGRSFVSSDGIPLFDSAAPRRARGSRAGGRVTVVVLPRRDAELAPIESRLRPSLPTDAEVVVVDGDPRESAGSPPSTAAGVVVRRREPLSRARRLNLGAEVGTGDVLVFLDRDDVLPRPGWLDALRTALAVGDVAAAGPTLTTPDGDAGQVHGVVPVDPYFNVQWIQGEPTTATVPVASLSLRAMATTRRTFELLGGFDPEMHGVGGEDLDFCLRAWRAGYRCLAVPAAQVEVPFETDQAEAAGRLHNTLRLGLVHLHGAALSGHLAALSAHPSFPDVLSALTAGDVGRRRTIVDALSFYDLEWVAHRLGIAALQAPPATGGAL